MDDDPGVADPFASAPWCEVLLRFNLNVAAYADATWLPYWAFDASPTVLECLSGELLREHGLDATFDWSMPAGPARLFMMDREERGALATAIGIAAHRDSLRQVVLRPRLTALRGALGDAFDTLWLPAAEAVPRSLLPWGASWDFFDADGVRQQFAAEGVRQMLRLVRSADPEQRAVLGRAKLCASRTAIDPPLPRLMNSETSRFWDALTQYLIPRWAPSWNWLF